MIQWNKLIRSLHIIPGGRKVRVLTTFLQTALIFLFYFAGQFIQNWFNLPIPGSIIGLLLLFLLLTLNIIPENWVKDGANLLLSLMMFFFVPATVGIMNYFHIFQGKGILLVMAIILSTCLVFIGSGYICEKGTKQTVKEKENYMA